MRQKTLWILAAAIAAVVASLWVWQRVNAEPLTVESVRKEIEQSLPIGSSGAEVDSYLDSHGILHSHINDSPNELALIRDKSRFVIVRRDIQIRFHFDHSGRLLDYSLQENLTGP
jgi:hypothetical protein